VADMLVFDEAVALVRRDCWARITEGRIKAEARGVARDASLAESGNMLS
jgi:hypothetical protein